MNQTIRFQQMADQRLFDDFAAGRVLQVVGAELIVINLDILIVDAGAMQMGDRLPSSIESVQRNPASPRAQALDRGSAWPELPASRRSGSG